MNASGLKKSIQNGEYDETFQKLYGDGNTEQAAKRYTRAIDRYTEIFGDGDLMLFSAPGRTEVGGNHTDHQHGCVLAGSVNLDVIAVVSPTDEQRITVQSEGFRRDEIDLKQLSPAHDETEKAASLIRGMCAYISEAGYKIGGFKAYTISDVLRGSGLSSSAAFEVLIGTVINHLYNAGSISPVAIAQYAQKAENNYFGKPSGLMDQMASAVGGFTGMDFQSPKQPVIESVQFDLAANGYAMCIVNTGGNHADLTRDYADVTAEMSCISGFFGKNFLRDVNPYEIHEHINELRNRYGDRAVMRALNFFRESDRAVAEKEALKEDRFRDFLRLVNESGNASFKYLQNVYSPSNINEQGLSLALLLSDEILHGEGAVRVHGGGFGGTIQAFVPTGLLSRYREHMENVFGRGQVYVLNIRPVGGTPVNRTLLEDCQC